MKAHLIIGGLLLVLLSLALAQDNPNKIEPIRPVTPIPEEGKKAVKPELRSPVEVTPTPESQLTPERLDLRKITPVSGSQETSPEYVPWGLKQPSQISVLQEPPLQYTPMALKGVDPVQAVDGMSYQVQEFNDFRGGLNLSSYKTKLAPNEASDLENALWNPQGEMYKRPGFSEHSTPPFIANFLYPYYQQDGDKWLMGGSDTSLHFWHEDSSGDGWTYLIGTEGTSGRWDGTTFDDLFVGTHEGIEPIVWDGVGFIEIGTIPDSFKITNDTYLWTTSPCWNCSTRIEFESAQTGWDAHEWADYILSFPIRQKHYNGNGDWDTLMKQEFILDNDAYSVYIKQFSPPMGEILYQHAKILSWFEIDTVWREGTIDSAAQAHPTDALPCHSQLWDEDFYWDSTFNYNDYIFEVTSGTGEGYRRFLVNWTEHAQIEFVPWDTSAFFLYGIGRDCFDSTTHYRIYKLTFWTGAKFCENFDSRLWFGWTGAGEEQEKNRLVWSAPSDEGGLGNWPPENYIFVESDDGDFITGMKVFEPEGAYRQTPYSELLVGKNQSLYRIFPYIIASELDYKTIRISSGVGVCSNAGMANVEGRFMIFPDQHGVFTYSGKVSDEPISQKIDPVFEGWNLDALEAVSAVYNPKDRTYYLSYPDTTGGEVGRVVVVWQDDRNVLESYSDIYAQVLIDYDSIVGSNIIVCEDGSIQSYPDVASDANGNFVVVWQDRRDGDYDIYARRYDYNGSPLDTEFVVSDLEDEDEEFPTISVDPNGYFAICWDRDQGTDTEYLGLKVYDPNGQLLFSRTRICDRCDENCGCCEEYGCESECCGAPGCCGAGNYNLNKPSVSYNYLDGANIVWSDSRHPYSFFGIHGNYITNKGGRTYRCDYVIHNSDSNAIEPACVSFYDGGIVTCWTYQRGTFDVYKTGVVLVNDDTTDNQRYPRVGVDAENDYVIVWQDKRSGTEQIYGQRYNPAGAVGSNFLISDYADSAQLAPDIGMDAAGNFVVVCEEERHATNSEIRLRRYDSTGTQVGSVVNIDDDASPSAWQGHTRVALSKGSHTTTKNNKTLAWNIDYHGWSPESFDASAYCYQHSITDTVKILFAGTQGGVYNYAVQADDESTAVILTYQSPYVGFSQYPSFNYQMRFATLEAYLNTGTVYLDWYKDYSDLSYQDSITCWGDCREEMALPDTLRGRNISMKLTTGSGVDDFTLSRFWWEGVLEPNRR